MTPRSARHTSPLRAARLRPALLLALAALATSGAFAPARAEDGGFASLLRAAPQPQGVTILDLRVEGAQRLERETVLSYLTLGKGDVATPEKLDSSLKALYATGLFADVALTLEADSTLAVRVEENPLVNRVTFEGNDALSKDELEKEVQLHSRFVYTLPRAQQDVRRILDLYRRSGRFGAVVEPRVVKLEQNRVDVVFEIAEGDRTGIRRIRFVGNDHFDESDLRGVVNSRESAWWRFFSTSDYYDPDRTGYDRELLRRFYLNEGYADARVESAVAELTPDHKDFFLTFSIEEGPRYRFGEIRLQSDIKGLDTEALREHITTKKGDWYSAEAAEKTIAKLSAVLGDMQYAFVEITPALERHKDGHVIDLTYRIREGQRVFIGRIDITGNLRTQDKVIRREMTLAEGDPFSTSRLQRSEQRIRDLGYFEQAKITPADGVHPDRADLKVEVKEKSTGEISFGAGFSTTDGPLGDFSIRERNFLGRGQDVRLGATISGITKQFDFGFTEPWFLDRDLSAGVDLFHIMRDYQSRSAYDATDTGFTLRMGYPLSEFLRQRVSYTLQQTEITNIPADASRFIRDQKGRSVASMFGQELTYDRRDSRLDPTKGYVVKLNTDAAGAGGDRHFLRARLLGSYFFPLTDKIILSPTAEGGYIAGMNEKIRINDRFFLGGDSLRGFDYAGIGPRDLTGGVKDALGGNHFVRGSIEVSLPVYSDFGLKGHIFTDAGILGTTDEKPRAGEVFRNESNLRASVGIGMTWNSPFGPVRLDFAQPVKKEGYDVIQHIHFSFGTKF